MVKFNRKMICQFNVFGLHDASFYKLISTLCSIFLLHQSQGGHRHRTKMDQVPEPQQLLLVWKAVCLENLVSSILGLIMLTSPGETWGFSEPWGYPIIAGWYPYFRKPPDGKIIHIGDDELELKASRIKATDVQYTRSNKKQLWHGRCM